MVGGQVNPVISVIDNNNNDNNNNSYYYYYYYYNNINIVIKTLFQHGKSSVLSFINEKLKLLTTA